MADLNLSEIQGIILRGYNHQRYSKYLFFQVQNSDKTKQWLDSVIPEITTSAPWPKGATKPHTSLNIAFSYAGLESLGYKDTTGTFSREFQSGMPEENRARTLGDTGESEPAKWELGGPIGPLGKDNLHILLMLYAKDWASLDERARIQKVRINEIGGLQLVYEQDSYMNPQQKEPFGFRDGLSQPPVEGFSSKVSSAGQVKDESALAEEPIKAGEFILGYPNAYNQLPFTPTVPIELDKKMILPALPTDPDKPNQPTDERMRDFGQNGSYMVYRKLQQDVKGFRDFMLKSAGNHAGAVELAAKFMGRWQSGTPLVLAPEADDARIAASPEKFNNFGYHNTDPHGYKCPIGSHVRRSNPRDSLEPGPEESTTVVNRHRIIRRGRPYGMPVPDDPSPVKKREGVGIIFIAINASIKRQFEFVQQMWVNDEKFDEMYDNKDTVTGDNDEATTMTIQAKPVRRRIHKVPRFVQVRGGGYFFLPSIAALKYLASRM
jgi:Dyp-type peroxidase family